MTFIKFPVIMRRCGLKQNVYGNSAGNAKLGVSVSDTGRGVAGLHRLNNTMYVRNMKYGYTYRPVYVQDICICL